MKMLSKLFTFASYTALPGWVLLIIFPHWHFTQTVVVGVVVTLLCVIYAYLAFFGRRHDEPGSKNRGHFRSLAGVMRLFESPRIALAGWVHYLAFDLMVGLFIVTNAAHYNISHWLLIPCLLLTLMFGPAGLLLYLLLRFAVTQDYLAVNFF